jgi:alkanesulfonate monooxygenase SsuD/methylene tetrahydromethanopterin reductase-like flavin-dependent oxidoreductase (luciferase family)
MGHYILMDPHATFGEIGSKYDHYVAELTTNGFAVPQDTPMARLLAVAETDDEAEQVARAGAAWTIGAYAHGVGATTMGHSPDEQVAARIEGYVRDRIVWGSPARVRDELDRLRTEMRLRYLMIAPLSHETFIRFTDDVLPHL